MTPNPHARSGARERILERAQELGFDLVGLAPFGPPPDAQRFEAWLGAGMHGSMAYLERGAGATTDPRSAWPDGRSLLMVGMAHSRPAYPSAGPAPGPSPGGEASMAGARVARYALGRDYHNVLGKRLQKLRRWLLREGVCQPGSAFVDATPLLERSHAEAAGIGFASKAANLLNPQFGPWFFLGEIILDLDLAPTPCPDNGFPSCGTCTACIDACPTDAITAPGEVDARRCISYATIEHRGLVAHELRESTGGWVFGCDICSEVCPWGHKAPDRSETFGTHHALEPDAASALLPTLLSDPRTRAPHAEAWRGSPLRRAGDDGLRRNAAIAIGNLGIDGGAELLRSALETADHASVRAAAFWGLTRGYIEGGQVRAALDRALANEPDEGAGADMRMSFDRAGPTPS